MVLASVGIWTETQSVHNRLDYHDFNDYCPTHTILTWLSLAMIFSSFPSLQSTGGSSVNLLNEMTTSTSLEHSASSGGREESRLLRRSSTVMRVSWPISGGTAVSLLWPRARSMIWRCSQTLKKRVALWNSVIRTKFESCYMYSMRIVYTKASVSQYTKSTQWTYSIGNLESDFLERSSFFFSGERPRSPTPLSILKWINKICSRTLKWWLSIVNLNSETC